MGIAKRVNILAIPVTSNWYFYFLKLLALPMLVAGCVSRCVMVWAEWQVLTL